MDTVSPVISLSDDLDLRPIKLFRDWSVDEDARTVFYRPRKLAFSIDYDAPLGGGHVRPSAIKARVMHVCDGQRLPAMETLERVGKDAIHAFVLSADVCQERLDPGDIPF
jgi:hypothetical protein